MAEGKSAISILQEFTMKNGHPLPEYVVTTCQTSVQEPNFQCKVSVAKLCEVDFGPSKQTAKHNAATKALGILINQGFCNPSICTQLSTVIKTAANTSLVIIPNKAIVSKELMLKIKRIMDEKSICRDFFNEQFTKHTPEDLDHILRVLGIQCEFRPVHNYPVSVACANLHIESPFTVLGVGTGQTQANLNAIDRVYEVLGACMSTQNQYPATGVAQNTTKTPVSLLQEFAVQNRIPLPTYEVLWSSADATELKFCFKVNVMNICALGVGLSKQAAKQDAARNVLGNFQDECHNDPIQNTTIKFNECNSLNPSVQPVVDRVPNPTNMEMIVDGGIEATQTDFNTRGQAEAKDLMQPSAESHALSNYFQECNETVTCDGEVGGVRLSIKKIMDEKGVDSNTFNAQFDRRNKESLDHIFRLLDLTYTLELMQEEPPIVCISFDNLKPFTVFAVGSTKERAEANAIHETYKLLDTYMSAA